MSSFEAYLWSRWIRRRLLIAGPYEELGPDSLRRSPMVEFEKSYITFVDFQLSKANSAPCLRHALNKPTQGATSHQSL